MALYLISYDIAEKDAFEYGPLWEKLREIGATRILYSEWVVNGDAEQASAIYNLLAPLIQIKDRVLVQEVTKDAHWDKLLVSDEKFGSFLLNARG